MRTRVLAVARPHPAAGGLRRGVAARRHGTVGGTVGAPRSRGTLTVLAAASLTETFTELEKQFEAAHPGVDVKLNYAGSSDLAQQIVNGAPADVFAAASDATMKTVTDAGLAAGTPKVFATNVLQIATAPGNPKGIASFADLAKPDLKVVVCAPQVPCGAAAEKIEKATGVTLTPGQRGGRRQVDPGQGDERRRRRGARLRHGRRRREGQRAGRRASRRRTRRPRTTRSPCSRTRRRRSSRSSSWTS